MKTPNVFIGEKVLVEDSQNRWWYGTVEHLAENRVLLSAAVMLVMHPPYIHNIVTAAQSGFNDAYYRTIAPVSHALLIVSLIMECSEEAQKKFDCKLQKEQI